MDSPIVVSAYYIQNMIQLVGPSQTAKILENLKHEKLFAEVEDDLVKLALKVAKDGKKVHVNMDLVKKKFGAMKVSKSDAKNYSKKAIAKTKVMAKKVKPKTAGKVVGFIGKKVPFVSVGVGAGLALWRILENPRSEEAWIKAGAEIASGTASCFPGIGTAVSMTIDGILVAADRGTSKKKLRIEDAKKGNKEKKDKKAMKIDEEEDLKTEENVNEKEKGKKKEKVLISALYTFSYQGNDICSISKLTQNFRVPQNFEIWFFTEHDSALPDHIYVDVLFYSMLSREASLQKSNYGDCVIPSNCCEKLLSGEVCNDYKIVLLNNKIDQKIDQFYLGLVKWTPKFETKPEFVEPINEDNSEYYLLSQIVCDLGRKENFGQKCVLLFLCDRTDVSEEQEVKEKVSIWRDRVKQLVPKVPEHQDIASNIRSPKVLESQELVLNPSPEDPTVDDSQL